MVECPILRICCDFVLHFQLEFRLKRSTFPKFILCGTEQKEAFTGFHKTFRTGRSSITLAADHILPKPGSEGKPPEVAILVIKAELTEKDFLGSQATVLLSIYFQ